MAQRLFTDTVEAEIAADYLAGQSSLELARKYETNSVTICRALRRQGVAIRPVLPRYTQENNPFRDPLKSEEACYFLGLLLTDGSIYYDKMKTSIPRVSLSLSCSDGIVVERLARFLGITKRLRIKKDKRDYASPSTILSVRSQELVRSLATFNIIENKTKNEVAPEILVTNPHFWIGCIDGDGCIGINTKSNNSPYPFIYLCGSITLVRQFIDFARTIAPTRANPSKSGPIWQTCISCGYALKIVKELYGNATISIPRKQEMANRIIYEFNSARNPLLERTP